MLESESEDDNPPRCGVCDSTDQFAQKYPDFTGEVWFTVVKRCDQPEKWGWRWRKWGEYIGNYDIDFEYLYDADGIDGKPEIDKQWLFYLDKCSNIGGLPNKIIYNVKNGKATMTTTMLVDQASFFNNLLKTF